jgi:hypothetical protein
MLLDHVGDNEFRSCYERELKPPLTFLRFSLCARLSVTICCRGQFDVVLGCQNQ